MFKAIDNWLPGYLKSLLSRPRCTSRPRHLLFCLCDHYEPFRDGTTADEARGAVRDWLASYPDMANGFRDADGRPPRHTFFYPQEEYDVEILDRMADFCRGGYGEVEIHLHHRHDTAAGLRAKLINFRDLLHEQHGLLGEEKRVEGGGGEARGGMRETRQPLASPFSPLPLAVPRYGFIHGNWALCNSRPDGDWCGVNEELAVLAETGCYADFTFPSVPSPTQPRMVNTIYYARDKPGRPRGADRGVKVRVTDHRLQTAEGVALPPRSPPPSTLHPSSPPLLLITGPLALNWGRRKWGILPRIENAEIAGGNPPTPDRCRLWVRQDIHVDGQPEWVFVKVHTHGCVPGNARVVLGQAMRAAHRMLQCEFNDGVEWKLHYVTAREMYNLVKAAEAGMTGDPGPWRDFVVGTPRGCEG